MHVDGGIRGCGVSLFEEKELVCAAYVRNPLKQGHALAEHVAMGRALRGWFTRTSSLFVDSVSLESLTFEHPRVVDRGHQKGSKRSADVNDLFPMVGVGGALGALLPASVKLITVFPDEWKGDVDKFMMNGRVWGRLTPAERARVERLSDREPGDVKIGLDHNTLDAVGIGLHHVGRLERMRVFE